MFIIRFIEDFLFRLIPLWFYFATVLIMIIFAFSGIYLTYKIDIFSSKFPEIVQPIERSLSHIDNVILLTRNLIRTGSAAPRVLKYAEAKEAFPDEKVNLKGYFLVSAYEPSIQQSLIYLFDLEKRERIKTWNLRLNQLMSQVSDTYIKTELDSPLNFRAQHPILTTDGGLIVSSGEGLLAKFSSTGEYEWHIERHFHHAIEPGLIAGTFVSQIIVLGSPSLNNGKEIKDIRNDGYVIFDENGTILEERSIAQILIDNGYRGLLFGTKWERDRIHINDAEFIQRSDRYVNKGDIMLSLRHLSTVLLYRPSSNKIVWLQTGPFLNQHDIDYLGNGEFMIYGNDNINFGNTRLVEDYSALYIYDMKSDITKKKISLEKAKVKNDTQGRSQLLESGWYFVEDSQRAMILDDKGSVIFSYTHKIDDDTIGALHWARYYQNLDNVYLKGLK